MINTKTIRFRVEQNHIDEGKCAIPTKCMISMALKAAYPTVHYANTRVNGISTTERTKNGSIRKFWVIPSKAAKNVLVFDAKDFDKLKPFTVKLELHSTRNIPLLSEEQKAKNLEVTRRTRASRKMLGLPYRSYRTERVYGL